MGLWGREAARTQLVLYNCHLLSTFLFDKVLVFLRLAAETRSFIVFRFFLFTALLGDPLGARRLAAALLPPAEPEPGGGVDLPQGAGGAQGVRAVR